MIFERTAIPDVWLLRLEPRSDARGSFGRAFCAQELGKHGLETHFVQANLAQTAKAGTMRGLHYQRSPHSEVKIIRCVAGAIYDVVVDMRPESPTYLQHVGTQLTAETGTALYLPGGFAHGYQALTDGATALYMVSAPYTPEAEVGVRYDDLALNVRLPLPVTDISPKDTSWPLVKRANGASGA